MLAGTARLLAATCLPAYTHGFALLSLQLNYCHLLWCPPCRLLPAAARPHSAHFNLHGAAAGPPGSTPGHLPTPQHHHSPSSSLSSSSRSCAELRVDPFLPPHLPRACFR